MVALWRLASCLLLTALALAACSERFVDVSISPRFCTVSSAEGSPKCEQPSHFGWASANPPIPYPPVLTQAGVTGTVTASVWVDSLGMVDSVAVTTRANSQFIAPVPLDVLFKCGGCPTPERRRQNVVALRASLLVEVLACGTELRRTVPFHAPSASRARKPSCGLKSVAQMEGSDD